MMTFTRRGLLAATGAALIVPGALNAGINGFSGAIFSVDNMALRGTDPVGYFRESRLVAGHAAYTTDWMGTRWYFASAKNREAFEMNPRKYAPQFGGYCALAASHGSAAPTDPNAWTIVDGKLYLKYSISAREIWSQDIPGNIAMADRNWPEILTRLSA